MSDSVIACIVNKGQQFLFYSKYKYQPVNLPAKEVETKL